MISRNDFSVWSILRQCIGKVCKLYLYTGGGAGVEGQGWRGRGGVALVEVRGWCEGVLTRLLSFD